MIGQLGLGLLYAVQTLATRRKSTRACKASVWQLTFQNPVRAILPGVAF